jgi:CheY-like chemotaxis protein
VNKERVQLIHWNADEAKERAERLRALGYEVDHEISGGSAFLREMGKNSPVAVVIDLARLPSQGRDMALLIRKTKATRDLPLVFIGGVAEKVDRMKELLPDAVYTSWEGIGDALADAVANPPVDPVVPESQFAAYAGKPLTEKLGIRGDSVVGLVSAPPGFPKTLGVLPDGAQLNEQASGECNLFLWFVRSRAELDRDVQQMVSLAEHGPLWIAWPKRASSMATDLTQQQVREVGLAAGLVDYKICAIDKTWSWLLFTRRKPE